MRKRKQYRFVNYAGIAYFIVSSAFASDWVQADKTKDGITVFRKDIPGSDIVAFRGEGRVDAPLSLIASIIFDCTRGTEWVESLLESRVLHWLTPSAFIEYDHIGTPFVMKDRDMVTRVTTSVDPSKHSMTIEYRSVEDPMAPSTSFVRAQMDHATFVLTEGAEDHQKTDVTGDIHCDPMGSTPKWIINFFQKDWPITTFRNLRRQATKKDVKVNPKFMNLFTDAAVK